MKLCKHCNLLPVFGKGYCRNHQYLRTDKPQQQIRRSKPLKSSKGISTPFKSKSFNTHYNKEQNDIFKQIWNERVDKNGKRKSEFSGIEIKEFSIKNFHHVYTKQAYPEWKLKKENIVMITIQEHNDCHSTSFVSNNSDYHINKLYEWIEEKRTQIKQLLMG